MLEDGDDIDDDGDGEGDDDDDDGKQNEIINALTVITMAKLMRIKNHERP